MKIKIDEGMKKFLKKDIIKVRILFYLFGLLFAILYLCINTVRLFIYKEELLIDFIVGFLLLVVESCIIIINIYYINQVFRRDYNDEPTTIDYSLHKDYILIHNISIDKKTKIYKKMIKHIFYMKNCAVVLTKDRHMYMIPNEVNIDILKKDANSI